MATDIRVEPLKEPAAAKLQEECRSSIYPVASVRVFPSGCAHTAYFLQYAERFRNFEIREDDVWIVSYPKCGKHKYAVLLFIQDNATTQNKDQHNHHFKNTYCNPSLCISFNVVIYYPF
jgi:hypothetical protein